MDDVTNSPTPPAPPDPYRDFKVSSSTRETPLEGKTPAQLALDAPNEVSTDPKQQALEDEFFRLVEIVGQVMSEDLAARYVALLVQLKEDQLGDDGVMYLGLQRAPAARGNHHAYEGGLVAHLLEMWDEWLRRRGNARGELLRPPYITDEQVLRAIIHHDLHKAWCTYIQVPTEDGSWKVRSEEHQSDDILNHTIKSLYLLNNATIQMSDLTLWNALALAQGAWTDQKHIKHTTVLAKIVYVLDDWSANVLGRIAAGTLVTRDGVVA